jgi:hypothetical protein
MADFHYYIIKLYHSRILIYLLNRKIKLTYNRVVLDHTRLIIIRSNFQEPIIKVF